MRLLMWLFKLFIPVSACSIGYSHVHISMSVHTYNIQCKVCTCMYVQYVCTCIM